MPDDDDMRAGPILARPTRGGGHPCANYVTFARDSGSAPTDYGVCRARLVVHDAFWALKEGQPHNWWIRMRPDSDDPGADIYIETALPQYWTDDVAQVIASLDPCQMLVMEHGEHTEYHDFLTYNPYRPREPWLVWRSVNGELYGVPMMKMTPRP